jgi:hypothetical protein
VDEAERYQLDTEDDAERREVELGDLPPARFGLGLPIRLDPSLEPGSVELQDGSGRRLALIRGLGAAQDAQESQETPSHVHVWECADCLAHPLHPWPSTGRLACRCGATPEGGRGKSLAPVVETLKPGAAQKRENHPVFLRVP